MTGCSHGAPIINIVDVSVSGEFLLILRPKRAVPRKTKQYQWLESFQWGAGLRGNAAGQRAASA